MIETMWPIQRRKTGCLSTQAYKPIIINLKRTRKNISLVFENGTDYLNDLFIIEFTFSISFLQAVVAEVGVV